MNTTALRPLDLILEKLGYSGPRTPNRQYQCHCPAHDDGTASLSVTEGDDGKVLLHCHAGCPTEAVVGKLGLRMADLMPPMPPRGKAKASKARRIVATYDYRDEGGKLLFQTVRYEPKEFRQRRPNGRDGWIWNLKDTYHVPYRIPELVAADLDKWVFVVEGEKDVEALHERGLTATCNPMGAGKWHVAYNEWLLGRSVAILPDNDESGRDHAHKVAQSLQDAARTVRVGLPIKGDVSDWLAAGGSVEELLKLVEATPDYIAPPPEPYEPYVNGDDEDPPWLWEEDGEGPSPHEAEEDTSDNPFDAWEGQGITAAEAAALGKVERRYLVEDLIREKSLSIFFGSPGDFKSVLLMDMALCISSGLPWLPPLPIEGNAQHAYTTLQSRVLWLNYDQGHDDVIERLGAMARAYGGGENVTAISHSEPMATLTTESQARALGEYCKKHGYRVLIVDSLLDVKGKADLQEAEMGSVLRLWRIVAEVGELCVIIIAHNTKASGDLYGSQFIKAKLDHLYHVSRPAGTDVAIIESKKQRGYGETSKLFARWTYQHYDDTRTLETGRFWGDSTEDRATHPNNKTQAAILKILMASPGTGFTAASLTTLLNEGREEKDLLTENAVRVAANRLEENERNVGKTKVEKTKVYHYGDLSRPHAG